MIFSTIFVAFAVLTMALIPWFVYLAMVTAAAFLGGAVKRVPGAWAGTMKFVFVIPAHDEEGGISATVMRCREVDYPRDQFRVVVIADNCIDQTAEVAQGRRRSARADRPGTSRQRPCLEVLARGRATRPSQPRL